MKYLQILKEGKCPYVYTYTVISEFPLQKEKYSTCSENFQINTFAVNGMGRLKGLSLVYQRLQRKDDFITQTEMLLTDGEHTNNNNDTRKTSISEISPREIKTFILHKRSEIGE